MKDLIIRNAGNSRYLKSNTTATSWDEAKAQLQAGLFPVDFAGLNEEGITEHGTALNTENLLSDDTATALGLDPNEATPNDAFEKLERLAVKVDGENKVLSLSFDGTTLSITTEAP